MSYAERLAAMDETYQGAEAATSGAQVPDGDYEGRIERFDFWSKDGGPLKLITEISIVGGEYAGLSAPSVWHELEDPDRIKWTKGYLELLGLQGIKLSELEQKLEPLVGTTGVAIRITSTERNGKTYRNTYVNEVYSAGPSTNAPQESTPAAEQEPEAGGAGGPQDEDDIPFARLSYADCLGEGERLRWSNRPT